MGEAAVHLQAWAGQPQEEAVGHLQHLQLPREAVVHLQPQGGCGSSAATGAGCGAGSEGGAAGSGCCAAADATGVHHGVRHRHAQPCSKRGIHCTRPPSHA